MTQAIESQLEVFASLVRSDIEEQMERLLYHECFCHSQRFPNFIRYVIGSALDGKSEYLKERTIGIEVFGRPPNYDTSADPIVRVTAAEIRKRIAQYYNEPGHENELRISIPIGRYCPSFDPPRSGLVGNTLLTTAETEAATNFAQHAQPATTDSLVAHAGLPAASVRHHRTLYRSTIAVLLLAIVTVAWFRFFPSRTTLSAFWIPLIDVRDPVLLCVGDRQVADPARRVPLSVVPSVVVMDDLEPLVDIAGLLQTSGQRYTLRSGNSVSLLDLRRAPGVFFGAYDNTWTMRLTSGLRYYFASNEAHTAVWIQDRQSSIQSRWQVDTTTASGKNYKDYGIVARIHDSYTGQVDVVVAGLYRGGTVAAGELITQKAYMDKLTAVAPRDWAKKNMEIVISTQMIDGRSTPPQIEATYFW